MHVMPDDIKKHTIFGILSRQKKGSILYAQSFFRRSTLVFKDSGYPVDIIHNNPWTINCDIKHSHIYIKVAN